MGCRKHVPGWHAATSELRSAGLLATLGVVVEQHPDRPRLFMQWKEFEWPLLWDPFNLLELPAVPITMILDSEGIIRLLQPKLDRADAISDVIRAGFEAVGDAPAVASPVPPPAAVAAPGSGDASDWSDHAVALALWGGADRLDEAVAGTAEAVEGRPDGRAWFRRGVILRLRHDSPHRRPTDFRDATEAWTRALEADPANYVRRRRIQQYGPRLAQPYAFYDWVVQARTEITERGAVPVALAAEPEGAEFSAPLSDPDASAVGQLPARPDSRIAHDDAGWIEAGVTVVPSQARPGDAVRVHLDLRPGADGDIHWNNETGPGGLWIDVPEEWSSDVGYQAIDVPPEPTSDERRHLEFEVRIASSASPGVHTVGVESLYAVCDDDTGVCMIRRRTIPIAVTVDDAVVGLGDRS